MAPDPFRILVVTADSHVGEPLRAEIDRRADGGPAEVRVIAPALTGSKLDRAAGNVDEARDEATALAERARGEVEGIKGGGEVTVGDADPIVAIEDALREFPADEILIVTHDDEHAHWAESGLFEDARERFSQQVSHYVVGAGGDVTDSEFAEAERGRAAKEADETPGGYGPRLSRRDGAGILVAIIGTIFLVILAAACPEGEVSEQGGTDAVCVARILIAGAFGLINLTHIVALFLFESVRYRGFWEKTFAGISLIGTSLAIVVSLAIGLL